MSLWFRFDFVARCSFISICTHLELMLSIGTCVVAIGVVSSCGISSS